MEFTQAIKMSLQSIWSNKVRSILTMLGIIIGVCAVIALVSVVNSTTGMITNTLKDMGTNTLTVTILGKGTTKTVSVDEIIKYVSENPELYDGVAPTINGQATVKYDIKNIVTSLIGTNETFETVKNTTVEKGRFITLLDVERRQKVVLIGTYVAKELFGEDNAIGKQIKINGEIFDVVGVLKEKQSSVQGSGDDQILIPYTSAQRLVKNSSVKLFSVQGHNSTTTKQAKDKLSTFLNNRLGTTDAFKVISQEEILKQVNQITGTLSLMLGAIAGISLIVGGIGIMNIMLVSVTERTREIGIRKAIGAKRKTILVQFLIESIVVSSVGGIIGILSGSGLTYVIGKLIKVDTTVSVGIILFSFFFSMAIGVFFGIYPANKASKLNPIEALRYE